MANKKKSKKKTKVKRIKKNFFLSVAIIIITITMLVSLPRIVMQVIDKYNESKELEEKLISLQEDEDKLNSEIEKLKDPDYLARYAREKYFYSKDGELILRLPEK